MSDERQTHRPRRYGKVTPTLSTRIAFVDEVLQYTTSMAQRYLIIFLSIALFVM